MRITNLFLLQSAIMVFALAILTFAGNFSAGISAPYLIGAGVFIAFAATLIFKKWEESIKSKRNVWLQPVSDRTSAIIINSVVLVWLCAAASILGFFLWIAKSLAASLIAISIIIVTSISGWYLRKHFFSKSLLIYGVISIAAFVLILLLTVGFVHGAKS